MNQQQQTLLQQILFIDLETVPEKLFLSDDENDVHSALFKKRFNSVWSNSSDKSMNEIYDEQAGLLAEFGKIACISIGKFQPSGTFYISSISGPDELLILNDFMLRYNTAKATILCAHNGKDFDFPFLTRRMIINNIPVPKMLDTFQKKSWELNHLYDTLEIWAGAQWKHRCSLETLAHLFGIPSPKGEMTGEKVRDVYYSYPENPDAFKQIANYCGGDVLTLANVFCRLRGIPMISTDKVQMV